MTLKREEKARVFRHVMEKGCILGLAITAVCFVLGEVSALNSDRIFRKTVKQEAKRNG